MYTLERGERGNRQPCAILHEAQSDLHTGRALHNYGGSTFQVLAHDEGNISERTLCICKVDRRAKHVSAWSTRDTLGDHPFT